MNLKDYQKDTLSVLRRFLEEARIAGPKTAYHNITREPEQSKRLGKYGDEYRPLDGLPSVPYICLRLPTGGGKTILAAHAVAIARETLIEKEFPLVLWLVPSNTIRVQTADALKNTKHPYRQVLDEAFEGRVRVFDIVDFANIRPHDIQGNLCIVVGTIQTLRVSNTDGRKVYSHHEELEPHFTGVSKSTPDLELTGTNGDGIRYSFANLLHIHRPLMIVDEAHNAVTGLTREAQQRVNPCAIIEFTATPRLASNTLHSVTAQELKRAEMIKLPIILSEHTNWQNAVNGAIINRAKLACAAEKDTSYIRPIVLFQAQPKNMEVTVEVLKNHLIEVEQIPVSKIAVVTGDQRELDGIDLFDPKCPIEYIITIEALKEGWDCSFAYVFCSVANIRSSTDVEQLLGRVLRMPEARRRPVPELNRAYAHISEPSFQQAAKDLCDTLVAMGFDADEAQDLIEPAQKGLGFEGGLFGQSERPKPVFTHGFVASDEAVEALAAKGISGLKIEKGPEGSVRISCQGAVSKDVEEAIASVLPETEHRKFRDAVKTHRYENQHVLSPAELGKELRVPRLMANLQGEFQFADTDLFMEAFEWSLLDFPAKFDASEFSIIETANSFEIDLDGNRISYQFVSEKEQLSLNIDVDGWTENGLIFWLDRQVRHPEISQSVLLKWLRDLVSHLVNVRKLSLTSLMRCKFTLARKVRDKIDSCRKRAREASYQRYLFSPEAKVQVSFSNAFEFRDEMYHEHKCYRGRMKFAKHFLGPDNVPAFDGVGDGEEFRCAVAIDTLPEVQYWIRNVSRHPSSFWLPTATDKFYPDFVALLTDGRLLIVEYKGELTASTTDTAEKRLIGQLWEQQSNGKGIFVIAERDVDGNDVRSQIRNAINR